jgi:hypothetical protein
MSQLRNESDLNYPAFEPRCNCAGAASATVPISGRSQPTAKHWFRRAAARFLTVAILCPLPLVLNGCAWYMYRGGSGRSALSGTDTSSNTGTLQWSYNVGYGQNMFPLGPVVGVTSTGGGVFVGDQFGNIYSISTAGKLAWDTPLPGGIGAAPNAVGIDGSVYAPQAGGSLFALSQAGVPEWTFTPTGGLSPANLAIARDGTIYTGNQCGVFYALNPDGSVKWKYSAFQRDCNLFTPTISAAVGEDGTVYAGVNYGSSAGGVLFALTSGGTLIWSSPVFAGTPAVTPSGIIYVISLNRETLFALNSAGILQWQVSVPFPSEFTLPAVAANGTIYVGTSNMGLWAIDPTGKTIWTTNPGGNPYFLAPPSLGSDGTIYIAYSSLYAVNPSSTLKWSTPLCGGEAGVIAGLDEPVIGLDGTIYMILDTYTAGSAPCSLEAYH